MQERPPTRIPRHPLPVVVALAAWLVGCGSATLVQRDAGGGQLRLEGSYGFAMGDAREQALAHCDGRYTQEERGRLLHCRCVDGDRVARRDD